MLPPRDPVAKSAHTRHATSASDFNKGSVILSHNPLYEVTTLHIYRHFKVIGKGWVKCFGVDGVNEFIL